MAWEQLNVTKSHLVYIILGGFTSLFMLCSTFIKERMYIGEATVATICGLIFGPHAANLINPLEWGNTDEVTLEFSRIVLVIQCFAIGVELPRFYMEKHWKSVVFLLLPVMTFGWLVTSLFIWWLIPGLNWVESLVVAACITATDPVLASSVVGKGKFARRVPGHLRNLLSAESGCNDGMAFPFIYISLYLLRYHLDAKHVTLHWVCVTILYECIFGAIYGFVIGYIARHAIKFAERHDLIDRESFLSFYFVLGLFCAGSGSILGLDDLLVGFTAGVGFSNDGWFTEKTEESHVSNVIDLLLNLSYFVYLGTIIPWEQFNNMDIGLSPWRLSVIAILVIFFRRIPVMLAFKPVIPDLKTWREALFAGHFGPIGVGAIFVAILARAELESGSTIPLAELPDKDHEHYHLIAAVWPIVSFLVISSIIVHGSSVAVFTLGKHINTLSITMSYTKDAGDSQHWLDRLPRISSVSRSQAKTVSSTEEDLQIPPGTLPIGWPGGLLRRVKDGDETKAGSRASSLASRRRKKKRTAEDGIGPGGPISRSAIFPDPRRRTQGPGLVVSPVSPLSPQDGSSSPSPTTPVPALLKEKSHQEPDMDLKPPEKDVEKAAGRQPPIPQAEVYQEGEHLIVEDQMGEVLGVTSSRSQDDLGPHDEENQLRHAQSAPAKAPTWSMAGMKSQWDSFVNEERQKRQAKQKAERKHEPARAYQIGNTIVIEDAEGEVIKTWDVSQSQGEGPGTDLISQGLKMMGMGGLVKQPQIAATGEPSGSSAAVQRMMHWPGFGDGADPNKQRRRTIAAEEEAQDDREIRFTFQGEDKRLTKEEFIDKVQRLDPKTRDRVLGSSNASAGVREQLARAMNPKRKQSAVAPAPAQLPATAPAQVDGGDSDTTKAGTESAEDSPGPSSEPLQPRAAERGRPGSSASAIIVDRTPRQQRENTAGVAQTRAQLLRGLQPPVDEDDMVETPAERRRREAALGIRGPHEDDSDDDDTERMVPQHEATEQPRQIRFAEPQRR